MANLKISDATDIVTPIGTDVAPIERPGNATAYKVSMQEISDFVEADIAVSPSAAFTESMQDLVGGMFTGNDESGITLAYDDTTGKIDATVTAQGLGDVFGPASAVDSNLAGFDTTTGKLLKDSGVAASNVVQPGSTHTLTNKTISLGSNTISGTLAQFNAAVSDADLVSIAGAETLTNKTLTTPTIASMVNANHDHSNAAGGGVIAHASETDNPHVVTHNQVNAWPTVPGSGAEITKKTRVVIFGDSISAGFLNPGTSVNGLETKPAADWPTYIGNGNAWANSTWSIIGSATGGDTTTEALARVTTDVIAYRPNIVTLLFGTNDSAEPPATGAGDHVALAQYIINMRLLIDTIQQMDNRTGWNGGKCKIILMTPPPIGSTSGDYAGYTNARVLPYQAAVRDLASEYNIDLIDLAIEIPNDVTHINADGIHLTDAGYLDMYNMVLAEVETITNTDGSVTPSDPPMVQKTGTATQIASTALVEGELAFSSDTHTLFVSDGTNELPIPTGYTVATTVGSPGSDTQLVTEQGIREALTAVGAPSSTDGQMLYSNGSNNATGTSHVFFDDVNTRLGVGTTSPAFPLHYKSSGVPVFERTSTGTTRFTSMGLVHNTDQTAVNGTGSQFNFYITHAGGSLKTMGHIGGEMANGSDAYGDLVLGGRNGASDVDTLKLTYDGKAEITGTLSTTGKASLNSLQVGTSATSGHVLTGDASGNATFQAIPTQVNDTAYAASWDGVTTIAPSKNAVYDKIESLNLSSGTYTPTISGETNCSSSTVTNPVYMRVGSVVTMSFQVTYNNITGASPYLSISLPSFVTNNFSSTSQATGVDAISGGAGLIQSNSGAATIIVGSISSITTGSGYVGRCTVTFTIP